MQWNKVKVNPKVKVKSVQLVVSFIRGNVDRIRITDVPNAQKWERGRIRSSPTPTLNVGHYTQEKIPAHLREKILGKQAPSAPPAESNITQAAIFKSIPDPQQQDKMRLAMGLGEGVLLGAI